MYANMDYSRDIENPGNDDGKFSGNKRNSASVKDVKKKLACINKRINDLHHQRKFAYRNSTKVKRLVHNQINQIVKTFRGRERSICSDVDEVYFSQDENINDELSRLQSVYAHCHALLQHIGDFKEKPDVLRRIEIILSEINIGEKPDVKPLEFLSDFERMKVKANNYGYLEGDSVKKDDFVYVCQEKDYKLSSDNCKLFQNKEFLNQNASISFVCKNDLDSSTPKSSICKTTESDNFQIIDLVENMSCQDVDEDFIMSEDVNPNHALRTEKKLNELSASKRESKIKIDEYNTLKSSGRCETDIDFNPEEEWEQILEMNKKISSWHGIISKETVNDPKEEEKKSHNKNYNMYRFLLLKDANNWLCKSRNDELGKEKMLTNEKNSTSPTDIIHKSFKSYLVKDNIQNWLSA